MKQNFSFIYKLLLLAGDALGLLLAFTLAYILRVSLDPRPIAMPVEAFTYFMLVLTLLPIWLGVFSVLGLYAKRNYERRPKEATRLFVGAISGVLLMVTFDFFSQEVIFPAKLVPIYAAFISFVILWMFRTILRNLRLYLYEHDYGTTRVVLVGNSQATYYLSKYLHNNIQSGIRLVAVVANKSHIYEPLQELQHRTLSAAIKDSSPHSIIQTDGEDVSTVYNLAIEYHLDYQFIPSNSALFTSRHSVELLGAFPIINVHTTPLVGYGRAVKRAIDIFSSLVGLIVFSPFIVIIMAIMKIAEPKGKVFFRQKRLSRFKKPIYIYKFRSHRVDVNGLPPEVAFTKLGRPELMEKYMETKGQIDNDPRVTRVGSFLRKTSLDELPQLINVLRGDISLVGPRALVPSELEDYEYKSLILSVKSGLTGLAQISGRTDISFEERRKLDMFYVQNWSIWMDFQIIIRTIFMVISGRSAR